MGDRYIDYYVAATCRVEQAEAALVRQELTITRLRIYGLSTVQAEEELVHMRQHLLAMRADQHQCEEQLIALGLSRPGATARQSRTNRHDRYRR